MGVFEDLTPYTYSQGEAMLNVGWLGPRLPFSVGQVDSEVLSRIAWLCLHETVEQVRGTYDCELCPPAPVQDGVEAYLTQEGVKPCLLGSSEIRVPGDGVVYAAPSLVLHYLVDHDYLPPAVFLRAVEKLPNLLPTGWSVEMLPWEQAKRVFKGINPDRPQRGVGFKRGPGA
jgi:hypothetical protein